MANLKSFHLFAGAGGGILADVMQGHVPVGAVEINEHCRNVLLQRQRDGTLPEFPVWDDIRTFGLKRDPDTIPFIMGLRDIRDNLVIAGGFPCQDVSCAGKGKGVSGGERSGLWKEMARIISEILPRHVFVENSPLLVKRGLDTVLADLSDMGYDAVWGVIGARHAGAPHKRDRMWIVAVSVR